MSRSLSSPTSKQALFHGSTSHSHSYWQSRRHRCPPGQSYGTTPFRPPQLSWGLSLFPRLMSSSVPIASSALRPRPLDDASPVGVHVACRAPQHRNSRWVTRALAQTTVGVVMTRFTAQKQQWGLRVVHLYSVSSRPMATKQHGQWGLKRKKRYLGAYLPVVGPARLEWDRGSDPCVPSQARH